MNDTPLVARPTTRHSLYTRHSPTQPTYTNAITHAQYHNEVQELGDKLLTQAQQEKPAYSPALAASHAFNLLIPHLEDHEWLNTYPRCLQILEHTHNKDELLTMIGEDGVMEAKIKEGTRGATILAGMWAFIADVRDYIGAKSKTNLKTLS